MFSVHLSVVQEGLNMRTTILVTIMFYFIPSFALADMIFATDVVEFSSVSRGLISDILGPDDEQWVEVNGEPASFVTLSFGNSFVDGPGDDIDVYLRNWESLEAFRIFASQDGIEFSLVGTFDSGTEQPPSFSLVSADLGVSGLSTANFIRLESVTPANTTVAVLPEYDAVSVNAVPEPGSTIWFITAVVCCVCSRRPARQ